VETIHSEVYRMLIDCYFSDPEKRKELLNAILTLEAVKAKAELVLKYANDKTLTFEERLVVFMFVEGILFSAAFCAVFWLKKRGLMPQLCLANYLISRDEGLHVEYAQILLKYFVHPENRPSVGRVYEILDEFIVTEDLFVTLSLPVELIGMNSTEMKQHVRYVADGVLEGAGYPIRYGVENPFNWMDAIVAELQTNFYEDKVGEYNLDAAADEPDDEFGSDDDDY
jgi:ribonucleotide reductase beta subunit family protein with ferritin-like domain